MYCFLCNRQTDEKMLKLGNRMFHRSCLIECRKVSGIAYADEVEELIIGPGEEPIIMLKGKVVGEP